MKIFLIPVFVFLSLAMSFAQDFASVGTEWYYGERYVFSNEIDYIKFTAEKDTVVLGKDCRKISKRHDLHCASRPKVEFVYSQNDKVYFYDTVFNEFQILYDFGASVSEFWTIKYKDEALQVHDMTVTVDSISEVIINGYELKELYVTYSKNSGTWPDRRSSKIIERIGDMRYMFNWDPFSNVACDVNISQGLRCMQDSLLGYYETGRADSCTYADRWLGTDSRIENNQVNVFPNPARNWLDVQTIGFTPASVDVFDLKGNRLMSLQSSSIDTKLDLSDLAPGLYVVAVRSQDQDVHYEKIVKE